jgi:hypothetical protein
VRLACEADLERVSGQSLGYGGQDFGELSRAAVLESGHAEWGGFEFVDRCEGLVPEGLNERSQAGTAWNRCKKVPRPVGTV